MALNLPFETAIRVRRNLTEDPMSGEATLSDWAGATESAIDQVLFSPGTSTEFPNVDLDALSSLAVLYLPHGADITDQDRVRIRGGLWSVAGRRADWGLGDSSVDGSVVNLKWIRDERNPDG